MSFLFGSKDNFPGEEELSQDEGVLQETEIAWRNAANQQTEAVGLERRKKLQLSLRGADKRLDRTGQQLGKNLQGAIINRPQPSFTREQEMLGQMFGHGDKIWGTNQQPVQIDNRLNSSRSDPWDETSSMFGTGPFRERSGLF